jgi:nucleoside-diphosphate-sugar epimerase
LGEHAVLEAGARLGIPVTVVQPAVVYGPFSSGHATDILDELRTGRPMLIDDGRGICNAVYVDDVVTGMLLAATSDRAMGERFLLSGPEHPTWRDFFAAFERMLGVQRTVSRSETEALALWERASRRPWLIPEAMRLLRGDETLRRRVLTTREGTFLRDVARRMLPRAVFERQRPPAATPPNGAQEGVEAPLTAVRPWVVRYQAKRARVRIDKARQLLGYEPAFDLQRGMALTEQWARWCGLLS